MKEETGKYDNRNKLNDLTGKEWLKLTKSYWFSEKCKDDKIAFGHPAPFLIKDIEKLISFFTKKGMKVLDPFNGSGTTIVAGSNLKRIVYGIDLNQEYVTLSEERLKEKNRFNQKDYFLYNADSIKKISDFENEFFDYVVTSPPYHNILKNKASGLRSDNSKKGYRNGSRQGVDYYSENENDLGNQKTFDDFLNLLSVVMQNIYLKLKEGKYCSIIISDFTVDKKEVCVQACVVKMMQEIGYEFVGTITLLQDNKPLYPFGYPFAYKINHHNQNIINFRKKISV